MRRQIHHHRHADLHPLQHWHHPAARQVLGALLALSGLALTLQQGLWLLLQHG